MTPIYNSIGLMEANFEQFQTGLLIKHDWIKTKFQIKELVMLAQLEER